MSPEETPAKPFSTLRSEATTNRLLMDYSSVLYIESQPQSSDETAAVDEIRGSPFSPWLLLPLPR